MTHRDDYIADRLTLLGELNAIELDLMRYEQVHGPHPGGDVWPRLDAVRAAVRAQLHNLLRVDTAASEMLLMAGTSTPTVH